MFQTHPQIAPSLTSAILKAVEDAARRIPPAFPLEATVAVNPFLGQTGEDLATASARLQRVAGVRATQPAAAYAEMLEEGHLTDADLEEAVAASTSLLKPRGGRALKAILGKAGLQAPTALPTVADLAADVTGVDWPSIIEKTVGIWAAGEFDRGQALWSPTPGTDAFASWRAWATHDLTPEIAGLSGFCAHVAAAPDTADRAILRAADALGLKVHAAETAFHRLNMDLGGWSQHARWLLWQAELAGGTDRTLADLLAIRLIWEEALLRHVPTVGAKWAETVLAHGAPLEPTEQDVALAIAQEACERAHQRSLIAALDGETGSKDRPALQAAFCIDVRSEVFRRALESVDPAIETIGFAGFFGLPLAHKAHGSDVVEAHLPVLLNPAVETASHVDAKGEKDTRIAARSARAWGRFRQAAVSSFAFVEAAGPFYAGKLVRDALGLQRKSAKPAPAPQVVGGLDAKAKADTAAAVLGAMSLTKGHGEIVLLLGHGGQVTNNPHESAYHCGACGGYTGEVSARLLAALLNDPETRAGLVERGIVIPEDTLFIAGLHDTTTDEIMIYDDGLPSDRGDDIRRTKGWLKQAGRIARAERVSTLPGATPWTIADRALNWAEVRPEWGLAGCAAFIAAPRSATAGKDLGGRAFLHSYDWEADDGFGTLELILTAPVVVASWISMQYYGSSVMPEVFGGGNKLIHNVVGGIGVIEGNSGRLRPGLPWQAVHDGDKLMHEPLRLSVMIEAPREAITDVLERHPGVRDLFDNGWLHLFTLKDGKVDARYLPGLVWTDTVEALAA
ncbi:YbcC family protein [Marimonas sp. MJW-29]|uniref:Probable inorganic carbon transporter subunit DabA n=1 Tax=Sulfitobacter sediminis TaxID=3234186 RepID=A0ABV3RQQ2_9RHOB